jgi:hypothetical protein
MKIVYTNHARKRMRQRALEEKQIIEIIEFPEYTLKRGEEIEAYKKLDGFMTKLFTS